MEPDNSGTDAPVESEFVTTAKYLDLYLRQKTDLYLQHYVFEPFQFLGKKLMCLSVILALFAAGALIIVAGIILLIATVLPLWAALLVTGAIAFIAGGILAYAGFGKQIVLKTPTATEMVNRGKA